MDIAIMSYSYASCLATGVMDTAATIHASHALGVRHIELMDRLIANGEHVAIERALADTGCQVIGYDLMVDFAVVDPAARAAALTEARQGLARAAAFGAPIVLLFPGRLKPDMAPIQARRWLGDSLRACVDEAARLGLVLTIENLGIEPALCGTADHLLDLCAVVGPSLRLTYDAGNFLLAGDDARAALARLAPNIVHVHLKDWTVTPAGQPLPAGAYAGLDGRGYRGAVLGAGVVDLPRVLGDLGQLGYTGYLSIEYEGVADPCQAVRHGIDFLRTQLDALR